MFPHELYQDRRLTAQQLTEWFERYAGLAARQPSPDAWAKLATHINYIAERPGGAGNPVLEEVTRRQRAIWDAAGDLRAAIERGAEFPNFMAADPGFAVFSQVDDLLASIGIPPLQSVNPGKPLGHPPVWWRPFGEVVAVDVAAVLRQVGKGISRKQPTSLTVIISTEVLNHMLRLDISPEAFATAMRRRRRKLPVSLLPSTKDMAEPSGV